MNRKLIGKRIAATTVFVIVLFMLIHCFELSLMDDVTSVVRVQMHEFYEEEEIDTLILGASPAVRGFDVLMMEEAGEENVFSLATTNQIAIGGYYLLKEAIARHDIDTVIYHTSKARFWETDIDNPYSTQGTYILLDAMRPSIDKYMFAYDALDAFAYVDVLSKYQRSKDTLTTAGMWNTLKTKLTDKNYKNYYAEAEITMEDQVYEGKGRLTHLTGMEKGSAEINDVDFRSDSDHWNYLERTIALCQEKDITFILVQVPSYPVEIFEDVEQYKEAEKTLQSVADKYGVPYWNFNMVERQHLAMEEEDFFDPAHMSEAGSEKYTEFLLRVWNEYKTEGDVFDKYCYESLEELEKDYRKVYGSRLTAEVKDSLIDVTLETAQASDVKPEYKFLLYIGDVLLEETDWQKEDSYQFALQGKGNYRVKAMAKAQASPEEYEVIQIKELKVE